MSQRQSTTVTCPQCGHSQDFFIWSSLNVSLDPDEKPRLLSGELELNCRSGLCRHLFSNTESSI